MTVMFFGKLHKKEDGRFMVLIPETISKKMHINRKYVVTIQEVYSMDAIVKKYKDSERVCVYFESSKGLDTEDAGIKQD